MTETAHKHGKEVGDTEQTRFFLCDDVRSGKKVTIMYCCTPSHYTVNKKVFQAPTNEVVRISVALLAGRD